MKTKSKKFNPQTKEFESTAQRAVEKITDRIIIRQKIGLLYTYCSTEKQPKSDDSEIRADCWFDKFVTPEELNTIFGFSDIPKKPKAQPESHAWNHFITYRRFLRLAINKRFQKKAEKENTPPYFLNLQHGRGLILEYDNEVATSISVKAFRKVGSAITEGKKEINEYSKFNFSDKEALKQLKSDLNMFEGLTDAYDAYTLGKTILSTLPSRKQKHIGKVIANEKRKRLK